MPFAFIDHTADVAVRLTARDDVELIQDAVRALAAVMLDESGESVEPRERRPITLEAEDGESLVVDLLNELVFLFDTTGFLPSTVTPAALRLDAPARLVGTLDGERFDPRRHRVKTEVKAATSHALRIRRSRTGLLTAEIVFDL